MGIRLRSVPLCHLPSVAPLFVCAVAAVVSVAAVIAVFAAFAARTVVVRTAAVAVVVPTAAVAFAAFGGVAVVRIAVAGFVVVAVAGVAAFAGPVFAAGVASAASVVGVAVFAVLSVTAFAVVAAFRISVAAFVVAPLTAAAFAIAGTVVAPRAAFLLPALLIGLFLPACSLLSRFLRILSVLPAPFAAAPLAAALGLIETGDTVLLRTVGRLFGRRGYVLGSLQPVYLLPARFSETISLTRAMESVVTLTIASLLDEKVIVPARMSFLTR